VQKKDLFLIYNPNSGKGKNTKTLDKIKRLLNDDFNLKVYVSNSRQSARDLAWQITSSCKNPLIVAAGGDGTINDIVNGCDINNVNIGILPVGTVNIIAKELGIEENLYKACEYIKKGNIAQIDVSKSNNIRFLFASGIGFDAQVVNNVSLKLKLMFGKLSYVIKSISVMFSFKPIDSIIINDNKQIFKGKFYQVIAGKTNIYAGNFKLFNDASLNNGLINLAVFSHPTKLSFVLGFIKFFISFNDKYIKRYQCRKIEIKTESLTPFHIDGDSGNISPVVIDVLETKLNVIVP